MMMIPEAWQKNELMPENKRAFYEYHSCLMEPWDGPASIAFTDGKYIGAVLDRNGLRPSRYYLTHDDRVIMASEVGVVPIDPANVKAKGRLEPGRMFLIDFERGRLVPDDELKNEFANRRPYAEWLDANRIALRDVAGAARRAEQLDRDDAAAADAGVRLHDRDAAVHAAADGARSTATRSARWATTARSPCLSDKPRMLYDYFRQLFAQVTNPPIDSIREEVIMSLECYVGPEAQPARDDAEARGAAASAPADPHERGAGRRQEPEPPRLEVRCTIDITFARERRAGRARSARSTASAREAERAIDDGYSMIVLSDRAIGPDRVPVSALLACGAVHHHLVSRAKRTRIGIVLETGEAREVHHHCLLVGYGADGINPYLAFEALCQSRDDGLLDADTDVVGDYRQAVAKGMLKVMAKMGISTLQSYKGAQIFEALGLADEVIERCFARHREPAARRELRGARGGDAAAPRARLSAAIPSDKLAVAAEPRRVPLAQRAASGTRGIRRRSSRCRSRRARGDRNAYQQFADHINEEARDNGALRGLLDFKTGGQADLARRGRARERDREALLHRRDELRLDVGRGARDARDRDEPHRRQEQHRRRRRGPGAVRAAAERRLAPLRDQADRVGPLRRHDLVPRERRRAADQDGAGREARRRRRAARQEGRRQHRADPLLDAGRGPDQPAAAPRHLLDRGSRAADPRPEELEPVGADQREARVRGRRRHDRRGRREGARGPRADLRRQRRHGRVAAHEHQARGPAVGARHRRDAPDARA